MPKLVKIAQTDDLSPGERKVFEAASKTGTGSIVIFGLHHKTRCIDGACPRFVGQLHADLAL